MGYKHFMGMVSQSRWGGGGLGLVGQNPSLNTPQYHNVKSYFSHRLPIFSLADTVTKEMGRGQVEADVA